MAAPIFAKVCRGATVEWPCHADCRQKGSGVDISAGYFGLGISGVFRRKNPGWGDFYSWTFRKDSQKLGADEESGHCVG